MIDELRKYNGSLLEWTFLMPSGGSFQILAMAESTALQAATCKVKEDRGQHVEWRPGVRVRTFIGEVS